MTYFNKSTLFIIILIHFACKPEMSEVAQFAGNDISNIEELVDIEFTYTEKGIILSILKAPIMNRITQPHEFLLFPEGFELVMFDTLQQTKAIVTCQKGKHDIKEQIIELRHNVVVQDLIENKTLYTEQLFVNNVSKKVYSEKFIKIVTPDKIIFGDGFESDLNFKDYYILKPKGEILLTR